MDSVDEDEEDRETEADTDSDSENDSWDDVLGTNGVLAIGLERSTELLAERGFGASLKMVEREGLSRVGLMAMVLREEDGLLMVALGLVKPTG